MSAMIRLCNDCQSINYSNATVCRVCGSDNLAPTLKQVLAMLKSEKPTTKICAKHNKQYPYDEECPECMREDDERYRRQDEHTN